MKIFSLNLRPKDKIKKAVNKYGLDPKIAHALITQILPPGFQWQWFAQEFANGNFNRINVDKALAVTTIVHWVEAEGLTLSQLDLTACEAYRQAEMWHDGIKQIKDRQIKNEAGTKFKDYGDGFYWIDLEGNSAIDNLANKQEADAMGHCGTDMAAGTFYSLRKDGIPYVTISVSRDVHYTYAREVKGPKNSKPAKKFHNYILDLFEELYIKAFDFNGVYAPENNFTPFDLDRDMLNSLIKRDPALVDSSIQTLPVFFEAYKYGYFGNDDKATAVLIDCNDVTCIQSGEVEVKLNNNYLIVSDTDGFYGCSLESILGESVYNSMYSITMEHDLSNIKLSKIRNLLDDFDIIRLIKLIDLNIINKVLEDLRADKAYHTMDSFIEDLYADSKLMGEFQSIVSGVYVEVIESFFIDEISKYLDEILFNFFDSVELEDGFSYSILFERLLNFDISYKALPFASSNILELISELFYTEIPKHLEEFIEDLENEVIQNKGHGLFNSKVFVNLFIDRYKNYLRF